MRCTKEDQRRLAREREEEGRKHEEFQQLLHRQLSKSTLLKSALDREVGGCVQIEAITQYDPSNYYIPHVCHHSHTILTNRCLVEWTSDRRLNNF